MDDPDDREAVCGVCFDAAGAPRPGCATCRMLNETIPGLWDRSRRILSAFAAIEKAADSDGR